MLCAGLCAQLDIGRTEDLVLCRLSSEHAVNVVVGFALTDLCVFAVCRRWAYNNNSKDTGGLVNDDWQTLVWRKLTW